MPVSVRGLPAQPSLRAVLIRRLRAAASLLLAAVLAGCASGRPMMPAPALYTAGGADPFADTAEALRTPEADVLYFTDRKQEPTKDGQLHYGVGRSASIAFGSAVVRLGEGTRWDDLESVARGEARPLQLSLASVTEIARAPPTPLPWFLVDGQPVTDPEMQARNQEVLNAFCNELARRMLRARRKEAFVYVHGVQNTFADSVFAMAELWHYLGREGVPMVFSWPAGYSGIIRGYTYDRESGEFAVFHMKQLLHALTQCSPVERISIVAHSRGTDVTLSALRELTIHERAAGRDPMQTLHLNNIVLAAPDLDIGVTAQRVSAERVVASARRWTIYTSPHDKAISLSEMLFGGLLRVGQLDLLNMEESIDRSRRSPGNAALVQYTGSRGGAHGHSYFRENPAVSSDLVLTLRYERDPGTENGRPLKHIQGDFWAIDDDYPVGPPRRP